MKINDNIRRAIQRAADACGNNAQLAAKGGIHQTLIGKYLSGNTKTISDDTWEKLEPLLRPYLGEPLAAAQPLELLKEYLAKGGNQSSLARIIGVTSGTISRWLSGQTPVTHKNELLIHAMLEPAPAPAVPLSRRDKFILSVAQGFLADGTSLGKNAAKSIVTFADMLMAEADNTNPED